MGLCNASGIGSGGILLDPTKYGTIIMCSYPYTSGITDELVLGTNTVGTISNSDLELSALVLREATLLAAFPKVRITAP